jgi:hypothetical protein
MASLNEIYSLTAVRLKNLGQEKLISLFLKQELGQHFFAPFLRSQKVGPALCEVAELEWLQYEVKENQILSEDFSVGDKPPLESGARVHLNPLSRWIHLSQEIQEWGLSAGLWLITIEAQKINYHLLSREHAVILDLVNEGFSLTEDELKSLAEKEHRASYSAAIRDLRQWNVLQFLSAPSN